MDFLDELKSGIVLIYGPAASGKTTLALQRTLELSKKGKVLFLDTENTFSLERIEQMDEKYRRYMGNILIVKPKSFEELNKKIEIFEKISNKFNMIILDSFGIFYRLHLQERGHSEANEIAIKILRKLKHISGKIPVIMTNQVYENSEGRHVLGGKMIRNFSDFILELNLKPRVIHIKKPNTERFNLKIENKGLIFSSQD